MRISHIGGIEGFGDVPIDDSGISYQPFHANWEAEIFGIMRVLVSKGVFSLDQFRDAIESLPTAQYLSSEYYARWVEVLDDLVEQYLDGLERQTP